MPHFKTRKWYWNKQKYDRNQEWLCWRGPAANYCSTHRSQFDSVDESTCTSGTSATQLTSTRWTELREESTSISTSTMHTDLICLMRAVSPAHRILLELIIIIFTIWREGQQSSISTMIAVRAAQQGNPGVSLGRDTQTCQSSIASRLDLQPTKSPTKWVLGGKETRLWSWPLTSI
jgi:hypothetical protein